MKIQSFGYELLFQIIEFIDYEEKLEIVSCCKTWYSSWMKNYFRKLLLGNWLDENDTEISLDNLHRFITNPYKQLSIGLIDNLGIPEKLYHLLDKVNYHFHKLECTVDQFVEIIRSKNSVFVEKLVLKSLSQHPLASEEEIVNQFRKITECRSLEFVSLASTNISIPFIPSLRSLMLRIGSIPIDLLINYSCTLHRLSLYHCSLSDVSLLGSIPHLELFNCENVVNISFLKNNDHVRIERCDQIHDFSQSFAHCRKIDLAIYATNQLYFDLAKWKKVEYLRLATYIDSTSISFQNHNTQLPKTVHTCSLSGVFVSAIDFTVTSDHALKRILLAQDRRIEVLEGYGLERASIIELYSLRSLHSLRGLEQGRTRKILLHDCNNITIFTPLQNVPIVEIHYCSGFTRLSQIESVQDLAVVTTKDVNFRTNSIPKSLRLSDCRFVSQFDGLEKIPELQLDQRGFVLLKRFLEEGKSLANERLVLVSDDGFGDEICEELKGLHEQFLKDSYDCHVTLTKRWVYTRK